MNKLRLIIATLLCAVASVGMSAKDLELADIQIRDPFIVPDAATGTYYMYKSASQKAADGTTVGGVVCYKSRDLKKWNGPYTVCTLPTDNWITGGIWAPEVHRYKGKYYLFATINTDIKWKGDIEGWPSYTYRGTQILRADTPDGPFLAMEKMPTTPIDEMALDGTLYVEDGVPYMVYCHEWVEVADGEMKVIQLSDDLSHSVGRATRLFNASSAVWAKPAKHSNGMPDSYVTDGCFLYTTKTGKLLMIWSNFGNEGYAVGIAESTTGKILGPWKQQEKLLFKDNGGHGMIFRGFDGKLYLVVHAPNNPGGKERAVIRELVDTGDTLVLK